MSDEWGVHAHLAAELNRRLEIVRQTPAHILLAGADGDSSRRLLAERYPKAQFAEYDARAGFLQAAADARQSGWLAKLTGKTVAQHRQDWSAPLPAAWADMLWSNLALAQADELTAVLRAWAGSLKTDGLLFFTHWGRDSLPEWRTVLDEAGIAYAAPTLVDMHDLGDMLPDCGFYDPITDTAKLQLDYQSLAAWQRDMDYLGLWRAVAAADETAARAAAEAAWQRGGLRRMTLETVYGHAVKKAVLPANESLVVFHKKPKS